MTLIYANIICAVSYTILIVCTFLNTKRKTIMFSFLASCLLYGIQSIMLKGYTGAFSQFLSCIMYFIYSLRGKHKLFDSILIPIIFSIGYIIIGIAFYNTWVDLLPLASSLLATISMWSKDEFKIKVLNIPISFLWITYNFMFKSYTGAVGQIILLISDFVFLYLYFKKYKNKNNNV